MTAVPYSKGNHRLCSFLPLALFPWNSLQTDIINDTGTNLDILKERIPKLYKLNQCMLTYVWWEYTSDELQSQGRRKQRRHNLLSLSCSGFGFSCSLINLCFYLFTFYHSVSALAEPGTTPTMEQMELRLVQSRSDIDNPQVELRAEAVWEWRPSIILMSYFMLDSQ